MTRRDHNVQVGEITSCQICGSSNLELIIDLGHQPLCDSLLSEAQLNQPETFYPLRLHRCLDCSLAQIDYAVDGSVVYHPDYPYRSGITHELRTHQQGVASDVIREYSLAEKSLVIDIGSNDGTLLSGYQKLGMRVLGVEPTNIAKIAIEENGVPTVQSFFNESVARDIVKEHGNASAVNATNVFAHMTGLGDVMRGVDALLKPGGVFVTESHYLPEIIKGGQYDTIYHEHLRSYSLKSLIHLFDQYDFTVVDCRVVNRYAGSIRVYAVKGRDHKVGQKVVDMLKTEHDSGIYEKKTYDVFRERVFRSRDALLEIAVKARQQGQTFVANSCPGRGSTLVNFTGLDVGMMPYICEQPTSLKLGMYLPGKHIPIVDNSRLVEDQPDFILLLAWHYADPIVKELRERGVRSKLVMPLPEVLVIEP